jgi:hypothetical protein
MELGKSFQKLYCEKATKNYVGFGIRTKVNPNLYKPIVKERHVKNIIYNHGNILPAEVNTAEYYQTKLEVPQTPGNVDLNQNNKRKTPSYTKKTVIHESQNKSPRRKARKTK